LGPISSAKVTIIEADYSPCPGSVNVNVFKDTILKLISKSPHQLASMTAEDMQHELATAMKLIMAYYKINTIKHLEIH